MSQAVWNGGETALVSDVRPYGRRGRRSAPAPALAKNEKLCLTRRGEVEHINGKTWLGFVINIVVTAVFYGMGVMDGATIFLASACF